MAPSSRLDEDLNGTAFIALVMNDLGVDERDAVRAAAKTRVAMLRMVLVSLAHGRHEELCQSGTTSRTLGPRSEYGTRRN